MSASGTSGVQYEPQQALLKEKNPSCPTMDWGRIFDDRKFNPVHGQVLGFQFSVWSEWNKDIHNVFDEQVLYLGKANGE